MKRMPDVDIKAKTFQQRTGRFRQAKKFGAIEYIEPPACPPISGKIDVGIRRAVKLLQEHGIETCQSCEGGPGHAYPEPSVDFVGTQAAGWKALAVCFDYGLPVRALYRVWEVRDNSSEPDGPFWRLVFWKRMI